MEIAFYFYALVILIFPQQMTSAHHTKRSATKGGTSSSTQTHDRFKQEHCSKQVYANTF